MSKSHRALPAVVALSFGTLLGTASELIVATPPASAATATAAADSLTTIGVSISGGPLTAVVAAPLAMSAVRLDGVIAHQSTGTTPLWTITNARGSGSAWSLSASATDFVSAAGTTGRDHKALPAASLTITPGVVTALDGAVADAAPETAPRPPRRPCRIRPRPSSGRRRSARAPTP